MGRKRVPDADRAETIACARFTAAQMDWLRAEAKRGVSDAIRGAVESEMARRTQEASAVDVGGEVPAVGQLEVEVGLGDSSTVPVVLEAAQVEPAANGGIRPTAATDHGVPGHGGKRGGRHE